MTDQTTLTAKELELAHVAYETFGQVGHNRSRRLSDEHLQAVFSALAQARHTPRGGGGFGEPGLVAAVGYAISQIGSGCPATAEKTLRDALAALRSPGEGGDENGLRKALDAGRDNLPNVATLPPLPVERAGSGGTCPTCGSSDPGIRPIHSLNAFTGAPQLCTNPFHSPPQVSAPSPTGGIAEDQEPYLWIGFSDDGERLRYWSFDGKDAVEWALKEKVTIWPLYRAPPSDGELLKAALRSLQDQHDAIDQLFAALIDKDPEFRPSKSPLWPVVVAGHETINRIRSASIRAAEGVGS